MATATYKFASGVESDARMVTAGHKRRDREMARIWSLAQKVIAAQNALDKLIRSTFGADYDEAEKCGRKQITLFDPTQLRRVVLSRHKNTRLTDAAWKAKQLIDNYIITHTSRSIDSDAAAIMEVLQGVFTGSTTLQWNQGVQKFLDLDLRDKDLRSAQAIIRDSKIYGTSREYVRLEERSDDESEWLEILKY